jgi:hypothetical protein
LVVALLAGGSQSANLNDPTALDARMANADNDTDPAVTPIVEKSANAPARDANTASRPFRSASPTPPPENVPLAEHIAGLVAQGQPAPGVADGDALLSGAEDGPDGNLNALAVDAQKERDARKPREKQKATSKSGEKSKEVIPDTESDGEKPVSKKRKRESEGKDQDRASKSGGKRSRKKEVVELDTSGDDGQPAPNSRHLSVSASQIYMDWNGALLFAARRRFQTLIFSRDGAGLKSQAPANAMNFKLVLLAAKAVMPAKEYASFRDQMDRAYQNKDKS